MPRILYLSQMVAFDHPSRASFPQEETIVRPLLESLGAEVVFVDVSRDAPPEPTSFDGVVVGGSSGSANDTEPWRLRLREWLATWQRVPLLGICGGHQLLAHALGAAIVKMERPQVGVHPLALSGVEGFSGNVMHMHTERVADVPPGATVWAEDGAGIQALRYGAHRWTVQFHPEVPEAMAPKLGRPMGATEASWPAEGVRHAVADGRALLGAWLQALPPALS